MKNRWMYAAVLAFLIFAAPCGLLAGDAVELFKDTYRKAEAGDADAQFRLSWMYFNSEGVPQNDREAITWLFRAAEQGHAAAQNNLGVMYYRGQVLPDDYVQAYKWYNLAVAQGNRSAKKNRDLLVSRMTPEQIAEGQRLSLEYWEKKQADAAP